MPARRDLYQSVNLSGLLSYQTSIAGIKDTIGILIKNDFDIRRQYQQIPKVLIWDLTEREQFRDGLLTVRLTAHAEEHL